MNFCDLERCIGLSLQRKKLQGGKMNFCDLERCIGLSLQRKKLQGGKMIYKQQGEEMKSRAAYIKPLKRRAEFLQKRIEEGSKKDLSYDKSELSSLEWAINELERNQNERVSTEESS